MRWLTFAILAACAVCFQTTLAARFELLGMRLDLVFVVLVHYALQSHSSEGLLAGWCLGVMVDLTSLERLGVVALVYGLAALAIWSMRELMFRKHPLTHFMVTAVSCLCAQFALQGYAKIVHGPEIAWAVLLARSVGAAVFTGLGAVLVHHLLLKIPRVLGLPISKRRSFAFERGVGVV